MYISVRQEGVVPSCRIEEGGGKYFFKEKKKKEKKKKKQDRIEPVFEHFVIVPEV